MNQILIEVIRGTYISISYLVREKLSHASSLKITALDWSMTLWPTLLLLAIK